jgi:Tfp pilus assembly protein PilO
VTDPRRQLLATAVIGLAACAGAYMGMVDQARSALARERARGASLAVKLQDAESARDSLPQFTAALARAREQAQAFERLSAPARDERALFSIIMAAAATHRLRIDQLNPSKAPLMPSASPGLPPPPGSDKDAAVGYSLTAIGSYADLAAFLRTLRSDAGFTTIRSVRMIPTPDQSRQTARAVIETAHFAFDAAPLSTDDAARLSQAGGQ